MDHRTSSSTEPHLDLLAPSVLWSLWQYTSVSFGKPDTHSFNITCLLLTIPFIFISSFFWLMWNNEEFWQRNFISEFFFFSLGLILWTKFSFHNDKTRMRHCGFSCATALCLRRPLHTIVAIVLFCFILFMPASSPFQWFCLFLINIFALHA